MHDLRRRTPCNSVLLAGRKSAHRVFWDSSGGLCLADVREMRGIERSDLVSIAGGDVRSLAGTDVDPEGTETAIGSARI
jgi:hypothetical protein